jgi:hypothetical protein
VTDKGPIDPMRPYESDEVVMTPANAPAGNIRNDGPEMLTSARPLPFKPVPIALVARHSDLADRFSFGPSDTSRKTFSPSSRLHY